MCNQVCSKKVTNHSRVAANFNYLLGREQSLDIDIISSRSTMISVDLSPFGDLEKVSVGLERSPLLGLGQAREAIR